MGMDRDKKEKIPCPQGTGDQLVEKEEKFVIIHGRVPGMMTLLQQKEAFECAKCMKKPLFASERGTGGNQKATAEHSEAQSVWVPSEAVDFVDSLIPCPQGTGDFVLRKEKKNTGYANAG